MAKLTVPTCWPRANMQKCPRWPFCPTYGSGVKDQICQHSPIPIRMSNYKHQIVKLLVPTCWPWTNMQKFPWWPFRPRISSRPSCVSCMHDYSFFFCQSRCNSVMTWPILTKLGGKDHWPCPNMSHDIDLHMTFDLDIRVKNVILL